ncbi:MAG: hypothetical protein AAF360_01820 [Pseudomonadota bacterium]
MDHLLNGVSVLRSGFISNALEAWEDASLSFKIMVIRCLGVLLLLAVAGGLYALFVLFGGGGPKATQSSDLIDNDDPARLAAIEAQLASATPGDDGDRIDCAAALEGASKTLLIRFDSEATGLRAKARDDLIAFIGEIPTPCAPFLIVEGHADLLEAVDEAGNEELSRSRALIVAGALADLGRTPTLAGVTYHGSLRPRFAMGGKNKRAQNMRVVVTVTPTTPSE